MVPGFGRGVGWLLLATIGLLLATIGLFHGDGWAAVGWMETNHGDDSWGGWRRSLPSWATIGLLSVGWMLGMATTAAIPSFNGPVLAMMGQVHAGSIDPDPDPGPAHACETMPPMDRTAAELPLPEAERDHPPPNAFIQASRQHVYVTPRFTPQTHVVHLGNCSYVRRHGSLKIAICEECLRKVRKE